MDKKIFKIFKDNLIVSCQALESEPLHSSDTMRQMANAVLIGGAVGIRVNSVKDIDLIATYYDVPIIGIIKSDYENSSVRITPRIAEVKALIDSKCHIIALDATQNVRPNEKLCDLVKYIRNNSNKMIMADCASLNDIKIAIRLGFDIVSSTLVGYDEKTIGINVEENDFSYLKKMIKLSQEENCFFIAEGNIDTPEKAKRVQEIGADSVVVGSAISRPQVITKKYVDKIKEKS